MLGTPRAEGMLTRGWRRARAALAIVATAAALTACTGSNFGQPEGTPMAPGAAPPPAANIGAGQIRVGLILPLSAPGNAGIAALSMKNAAEMALAEFKEPNIQLLVKDDAGTPQGAQQAAQQALDEGAEIIVGPLFAQSVSAVGSVAHASADATVTPQMIPSNRVAASVARTRPRTSSKSARYAHG